MKTKTHHPLPAGTIESYDQYLERFLPEASNHITEPDQDPREIGARMARESLQLIRQVLKAKQAA